MNESTYIHVRVTVNARKDRIEESNGKFFVTVKEKAEKGLANAKVKKLLATRIGCSSKSLRLIKGAKTSSKTYLLN